MFRFDTSTLDNGDIADTIQAFSFPLERQPDEFDNVLCQYLLPVLSDKTTRRKVGKAGGPLEILYRSRTLRWPLRLERSQAKRAAERDKILQSTY